MSKIINCNQITRHVTTRDQYADKNDNPIESRTMSIPYTPGDRSLQTGIRLLRDEQKLTQASIATMLGIKREAYARIESGKFAVSLDTFERIIDILGYSITITPKEDIHNI